MLLQLKQQKAKKELKLKQKSKANRFLLNMPLRFRIGGEASLVFADLLKQVFPDYQSLIDFCILL